MREAFDLLSRTGALEARELPPSPALLVTQNSLWKLWSKWSNADLDAIAADNLYLDRPRSDIQSEFAQLKSKYSECRQAGGVQPQNRLRGSFDLACKEGEVSFDFTLAPTTPPKLQFLRVTGVKNMNPAMRAAAETESARAPYGNCRIKSTLAGDGSSTTALLLQCDRGPVQLNLKRNGERFEPSFLRAPGASCMP